MTALNYLGTLPTATQWAIMLALVLVQGVALGFGIPAMENRRHARIARRAKLAQRLALVAGYAS